MQCGLRQLGNSEDALIRQVNALSTQNNTTSSSGSGMTPSARAMKVEQDINAVFLDWKSTLTRENENKYKTALGVKFIKLENFETGVCVFNDVNEKPYACARLSIEESNALVACDPDKKQEWNNVISKAFASLSKYFEGEQQLNVFEKGMPFCDRLLKNYTEPNPAMQKLIETCQVRDLFATQSGMLCIQMDNKKNMTPELLAKCMMTDLEFSAFECNRILQEFDKICGFVTKSLEPPYEEISILVRTNVEQAKELISAIVSKFKDPDSQIKMVFATHYRGWKILPAMLDYFEKASTHASIGLVVKPLEIESEDLEIPK